MYTVSSPMREQRRQEREGTESKHSQAEASSDSKKSPGGKMIHYRSTDFPWEEMSLSLYWGWGWGTKTKCQKIRNKIPPFLTVRP